MEPTKTSGLSWIRNSVLVVFRGLDRCRTDVYGFQDLDLVWFFQETDLFVFMDWTEFFRPFSLDWILFF